MNIEHLKEMLKRHEGYSSDAYTCPAGKSTIGWGHNIDANPLPKDIEGYLKANGNITPEMSERLLDADIKEAMYSCKALFPNFDEFSDIRQEALIDFLFNVGIVTARKFKNTRQAIIEQKWDQAALGLRNSLWFAQVGNRAVEIVKMIQEG